MDMSSPHGNPGRILALDYGSVHTGAAVCDPGGTIVRPLPEVKEAASTAGLAAIAGLARSEEAVMVIVGMPVSLSGEHGGQARETAAFIEQLRSVLSLPVKAWDERFTSKIARERGRGSSAPGHSIAACCLLEDYLTAIDNGG